MEECNVISGGKSLRVTHLRTNYQGYIFVEVRYYFIYLKLVTTS